MDSDLLSRRECKAELVRYLDAAGGFYESVFCRLKIPGLRPDASCRFLDSGKAHLHAQARR
jgi:hypothetical protein